jgi:hypothetical protein
MPSGLTGRENSTDISVSRPRSMAGSQLADAFVAVRYARSR